MSGDINTDGDVPEVSSGVSSEQEQTEINRIKRRNLIIAGIFGIILMVLGFFAGHALKQYGESEESLSSVFVQVCSPDVQGMCVL